MDDLERITLTLWMSKILPNPFMQHIGRYFLIEDCFAELVEGLNSGLVGLNSEFVGVLIQVCGWYS